jgi:hypothetical protein
MIQASKSFIKLVPDSGHMGQVLSVGPNVSFGLDQCQGISGCHSLVANLDGLFNNLLKILL